MASEEKRAERKLLICRVFSKEDAFEVGKELEIPFFDRLVNCWEADNDEASLEIAKKIDDLQEVIQLLKGKDLDVDLQFINMRN